MAIRAPCALRGEFENPARPSGHRILRPTDEGNTMKVLFDEKADAVYIRLHHSDIRESEEVQPGVVLDFDESGEVVAIEILRVSRRVPKDQLRQIHFEVA
jgi:uncharacterized protein YuzE